MMRTVRYFLGSEGKRTTLFRKVGLVALVSYYLQMVSPYVSFYLVYFHTLTGCTDYTNWKHFPFIESSDLGKVFNLGNHI